MGAIVTDDRHYKNIANNIREKTGSEETFTPEEMSEGVSEVYEAGKKSQHDEFMDNYMKNMSDGGEAYYLFSGSCWNGETFYPTRDIRPMNNCSGMFQYFSWQQTPIIDLAQRLDDCGVELDLSDCGAPAQMFAYCFVTRLPKLDFSNVTNSFDRTWRNASTIVTIDEIVFPVNYNATFSNAFQGCSKLKNLKASGEIRRTIDFSACPLTVESMKTIISSLIDYSGTNYEHDYTVSFSGPCKTALETEGATAEYNGEACTWLELIEYKKWNH